MGDLGWPTAKPPGKAQGADQPGSPDSVSFSAGKPWAATAHGASVSPNAARVIQLTAHTCSRCAQCYTGAENRPSALQPAGVWQSGRQGKDGSLSQDAVVQGGQGPGQRPRQVPGGRPEPAGPVWALGVGGRGTPTEAPQ